jgi:hypothetical protein
VWIKLLPRRAMGEDVADGLLVDVRGVDLASLLTDGDESSVTTALDRILMSNAGSCNDFNNSID